MAAFAVADVTGVRALGGIVLVAGAIWGLSRFGTGGRSLAVLGIALALFVASHPLGDVIGAWPAVLVSAALLWLASARLTPAR